MSRKFANLLDFSARCSAGGVLGAVPGARASGDAARIGSASRPVQRRTADRLAMLAVKLLPKHKKSRWPLVPRYIDAA